MNREHSCKISSKNSKWLLKNLQKMAKDYFFWHTLYNLKSTLLETRKLCYRRDDRAMGLIYIIIESWLTRR